MAVFLHNLGFDAIEAQGRFQTAAADAGAGASVGFIGWVRNDDGLLEALEIEHYPAMTQSALEAIERQARDRWKLKDTLIIHRYGRLLPHEAIVLVCAGAEHRRACFEAVEFMMDYLKSSAPFWKKEISATQEKWVTQKQTDTESMTRWT